MTKQNVLKRYYNYDFFRPAQETLIDSLLSGRDTIGIMPTGAGKSICYQIPALIFDGITLVISPLISLMKDQVAQLKQLNIPAAYINSSLTVTQYPEVMRRAKSGRYKIIYLAPERLKSDIFLEFIHEVKISMIAVDEAHCVSQWGQDFRPSYLGIAGFINNLQKRPVIGAFTATATYHVKKDIIRLLKLNNPAGITTGFDRPNLHLSVLKPEDKFSQLCEYIGNHTGQCGIIYCSTRRAVETICIKMQHIGINVTKYHAGLTDWERQRNQDDFINENVKIIIATNAFGMGINKSNVRYVIHYNMPKNMESYYQEAGRAGRDGLSSECIILFSEEDIKTAEFFIKGSGENKYLSEKDRNIVHRRDIESLEKMIRYCETGSCLRSYMLRYFGERTSKNCRNCSNCNKPSLWQLWKTR